ncbi:MarR family transcriptional regulator [Marivita sp.]|uniref:MarR family transcriptional regulator n=1 Tax=Marivita sp. TaxID=2003365 RepID=UPI003F6A737E
MTALCVLTGDLVASSDLSPEAVDHALTIIETAATDMAGWNGPDGLSRFARRGGDSWQIALANPSRALRAALFVQACLRRDNAKSQTRVAVATGTGALPTSGDLNAAHGPAFVESGRLLSTISGHTLMAHAKGGAHHAATRLADHIASGWTQAQARAVAALISPNAPPRAEVAASFGITRQAVNQALWSAGYPALLDAITAIEADESK